MRMTDGGEGRIVVHEVLVSCLVRPVDGVDGVRLVVAVLYALLVAVMFFSVEDERDSLRGIYSCLGKLDHPEAVFF